MDGFGDDDFTNSAMASSEVDPAAEFLAREQNQLAGLEDDLLTQGGESAQPAQGKAHCFLTRAPTFQESPL